MTPLWLDAAPSSAILSNFVASSTLPLHGMMPAASCSVPDLAPYFLRAGHPGWSIWGMDSEAFLQDWKERPERVHIVAPLPTTTHALSSNMLYQPQPQGEPGLFRMINAC